MYACLVLRPLISFQHAVLKSWEWALGTKLLPCTLLYEVAELCQDILFPRQSIYLINLMNPLQVHAESVKQAKHLLQMPPVLPMRQRRKSVIEVDKKLAEAIENRFIFTETTHHKDDKVRICECVCIL